MFDEVLIAGERLKRTRRDAGQFLSFKIRLPWYRSIYLSCVDGIELALDDKPQALENISLQLYGTTYRFSELTEHHSVLWFVLDQAEILVRQTADLTAQDCQVALTLFFRIPYHRTMPFRQVSTCARSLRVEERVAL